MVKVKPAVHQYGSEHSRLPTAKLTLTILAVTLTQCFPSEYQSAMVNQPMELLIEFTNTSYADHYGSYLSENHLNLLWGALLGGGQGITGLICTVFLHHLVKRFGLRKSLFVAGSISNIIGPVSSAIGYRFNSFELFFIGQTIGVGFSWALTFTLGGVYLTECSPPNQRGMVALYISCMGVYVSLVIAYLLGLSEAMGTDELLPYYFGLPAILAALGLALFPFLDDTPKEALIIQKDRAKSETLIRLFYGKNWDIEEIQAEFAEEEAQTAEEFKLIDLFKQYHLRQALWIACLGSILNFTAGPVATMVFSTLSFEQLKIPHQIAQWATIAIALPLPLLTIPSSIAVEKLGRRMLLLQGGAVMLALLAGYVLFGLLSTSFNMAALAYIALACLVLNGWLSPFGPPTVGLFIGTELFPQKARTAGFAGSMFANYVGWAISAGLYPLVLGATGPWAAIILLVGPSIPMLAYLWWKTPETAGRPCNDVVNVWFKKESQAVDLVNGHCEIDKVAHANAVTRHY